MIDIVPLHGTRLYLSRGPKKPRLVLDLDGTLTEDTWPALGGWRPGAIDALHALSEVCIPVIHSCRLSPVSIRGNMRHPADVQHSINQVREMLDDAALRNVEIHTDKGKPGGFAYVDNKAVRYSGTKNAWRALTPRLLAMAGDLDKATEFYDRTYEVHDGEGDHT